MNSNIIKSAKKFVRKELKYKVNFETITSYLQRTGYTVVFYNTACGNSVIESLGLSEYAKTVPAFTIQSKGTNAVFIDTTIPTADKLYSMLHETAHIYLKHLESDKTTCDSRRQEMEAEAFSYEVLNCKKPKKTFYSSSAVIILMLIAALIYSAYRSSDISGKAEETVYITQAGEKYHRSNCIYIRNKDCTKLPKTEAAKSFDPCMMCNP